MSMPVGLGSRREFGIDLGKQGLRQARSENGVGEVVETKGGKDFMDMKGKRSES